MVMHSDKCAGCDISRRMSSPRDGVLRLKGGWLVNQYGGKEGFLGWLALQPHMHRDSLNDLSSDEQQALGENLVALDKGLRKYWEQSFSDDPIEQVYFAFFYESRFDRPDPYATTEKPYHVHIHVIPRTIHLGCLLREDQAGTSIINAWQVWQLKGTVPEPYRRSAANTESWAAATDLIAGLQSLVPGATALGPPTTPRAGLSLG